MKLKLETAIDINTSLPTQHKITKIFSSSCVDEVFKSFFNKFFYLNYMIAFS